MATGAAWLHGNNVEKEEIKKKKEKKRKEKKRLTLTGLLMEGTDSTNTPEISNHFDKLSLLVFKGACDDFTTRGAVGFASAV
jgi:hypothetical protein